ncbi:MAG TPA: NADH-quinone oxidoreductase subunit A [Dehalococcoidia bacterium]|jgi:NADH-quinone oxidoreductase subunit A|nr:MAG: NADH-quinone oxidoreductase subunit A [SAR202 cluster bacterium]HIM81107.1 NADH-quinone oxidoreductase subunit A [Dehalococcoidia bacterium]|tara:strand:+ start:1227 stop:1649 length:423 start_codon:yes stop_codon:yes gene_type:complete
MSFIAGLNLQAFNPGLFAENWTAVALSAVVAAVAILGMFATSQLLSARRHSEVKLTTYECGIPVTSYSWSNINVRFYIFAILFLIFDVEAVFLFPWAVIFMEQKVVYNNVIPFYAMIMFLGVLFFAIVYAWRKGVLEWRK